MNSKYQSDKIIFPKSLTSNWRRHLKDYILNIRNIDIELDCGDWELTCKDFTYLKNLCTQRNIEILSVKSSQSKTIISASAIGLNSFFNLKSNNNIGKNLNPRNITVNDKKEDHILFHQGTIRAGERLESKNDIFIFGDVNPGAIVSAGGNVMIWGRLLGIAHAGKNGNDSAKITAMQLKPVQLRISNKVARGPKENPEEGFAEEARIEEGLIVIKPART